MSELKETVTFARLEDFINMAEEGTPVRLEIELRKQPLKQKVHPGESADMGDEIDTYVLLGDFTFDVEGKMYNVSKSYVFAGAEMMPSSAMMNRNVANARLRVDYQRLREAGIEFEEKDF